MFISAQPSDPSELFLEFHRWCGGAVGQHLVEVEQQELARELHRIFGYHLVVVDPCRPLEALRASRILHQVVQSSLPRGNECPVSLIARQEQMPWQTDSVDAFVLPHTLEHSADPHQTLRELDRCLVPEGHLIILGFNPRGVWGLRRFFAMRSQTAPWNLRFIALARLRDWLSLLGYDCLMSRYYFPRLPWAAAAHREKNERWSDKAQKPLWPLIAACYLLVAQKRVVTLSPIKPRWRPRRSLVGNGIIETQQRGLSGHGRC